MIFDRIFVADRVKIDTTDKIIHTGITFHSADTRDVS
jgi:hypothetical protein